ncbi:MAG: DNA translocase FtsK 4TM domain-containing protein, partial [Erythrobacter sp.]
MASRAALPNKPGRQTDAEWRAGLRRTLRRIAQMTGAGLLLGVGVFLGLALASYTQTDPSPSTAADPAEVSNWMGAAGAWAADRVLLVFGLPGVLLLPLLYVSARKLWRDVENGDEPETTAWWMPAALLLIAMTLVATVLSLAFPGPGGTLPAQAGGLAGLFGAGAIHAVAARFGEASAGWVTLGLGTVSLGIGVALLTRIFAIDWRVLMSLPEFLGGGSLAGLARRLPLPWGKAAPALAFAGDRDDDEDDAPARPRRAAKGEAVAAPVEDRPRRAPEISDPSAPPKRAAASKTAQTDMFAPFNLPSLDLLAEPPVDKGPKLDKVALERNARLLENVLDDFNVKGEITAVRTGPVVTMYELEPAPGIKASRVVGLAEDIARNMSAISARVSPIPGRTVMGIELPNQDRQMVALKELAAAAAFVDAKGNLPIILGKDIAGEPIIADLAAMPHLLVAGTTGSGKSVGLNVILLSLLYRFTPAELRLILIDPKVLELKTYDDIPHLLSPVVTEPAKSVRALKWAVEEMERRYRMMSAISSRNINSFNEKVSAAIAKGKP